MFIIINILKICLKAENLDVNAAVHGNWTIDNAKSRLNQFIQSNKLKNIDYKYSFMGKLVKCFIK